MTTTPIQTLSSGKTLAERYGGFGISGRRMVALPSKLFGMIVGLPNAGKTHFFASNPAALIVNCDGSSTPYPEGTPAQFYPGIGEDGDPIDINSKKITLSWDHVETLKQALIMASKEGRPRPDTIILDSLGSSISLLQSYITSRAGKAHWRDLHGQQAWDTLYGTIIEFAQTLRAHGYGVYYICHLSSKYIPLEENRYKDTVELRITDNFYARFNPFLEFVGAIESRLVREEKEEFEEVEVKGVMRKIPRRTSTQVQKHFLINRNEKLSGILKSRVKLPDEIELPESGAWAHFDNIYRSAST